MVGLPGKRGKSGRSCASRPGGSFGVCGVLHVSKVTECFQEISSKLW